MSSSLRWIDAVAAGNGDETFGCLVDRARRHTIAGGDRRRIEWIEDLASGEDVLWAEVEIAFDQQA